MPDDVFDIATTPEVEDVTYRRVRDAVLSGSLTPEMVYTQAELMKHFGVGRTPLREAVRRLQSEGLFLHEPNRRLRVSPLTTDDLCALYAMRITLEPLAVRLTVPRLTSADRAQLVAVHDRMDEATLAGDYEATRGPHREFHRILVSRAGGRFVSEILELRDHSDRYRRLLMGGAQDSIAMIGAAARAHRAILDAALIGEADRCAELTAHHLARIGLFIFAEFEGTYDPYDLRVSLQFARAGTSQEAGAPAVNEGLPTS